MTTEEFKVKILPHYRCMYRIAASVMKSDVEASDVVQDVMLKLYERRNQLKDVVDIRSYCINVVRNACLNIMRGRKDIVVSEETIDVESMEDIQTSLEYRDMKGIVGKIMDCLQVDQKNVLKLSAFGGFSNAEIAEMLGLSQGNVRVLLHRARHKIKELMSK